MLLAIAFDRRAIVARFRSAGGDLDRWGPSDIALMARGLRRAAMTLHWMADELVALAFAADCDLEARRRGRLVGPEREREGAGS